MLRLSILLVAGATAFAQQYTISTVAGGAPPATPAPAASTSIGVPHRVMASGNKIYFSAGNSVFRMDGGGTMTLLAGNSRAGFWGDGGPATDAQIHAPVAVAVDKNGQVFIAASADNTGRMVGTDGNIILFAG